MFFPFPSDIIKLPAANSGASKKKTRFSTTHAVFQSVVNLLSSALLGIALAKSRRFFEKPAQKINKPLLAYSEDILRYFKCCVHVRLTDWFT